MEKRLNERHIEDILFRNNRRSFQGKSLRKVRVYISFLKNINLMHESTYSGIGKTIR